MIQEQIEMPTPSRTGIDKVCVITTDVMHSANFVKEIGYPGMIKASVGDTISDKRISTP
jgi:hypothetical protein